MSRKLLQINYDNKVISYVNSNIWDSQVFQELPLEDRDLYFYLMTNKHIEKSGVMEYNIRLMELELNRDKDSINNSIQHLEDLQVIYIYKEVEPYLIFFKDYLLTQAKDHPKLGISIYRSITSHGTDFLNFCIEHGFEMSYCEQGRINVIKGEAKKAGFVPASEETIKMIHGLFEPLGSDHYLPKVSKRENMLLSHLIYKYGEQNVIELARAVVKAVQDPDNPHKTPNAPFFFATDFDRIWEKREEWGAGDLKKPDVVYDDNELSQFEDRRMEIIDNDIFGDQ